MNSNRPYLIRALYEWIVDNKLTPYILVDAEQSNVEVPKQYIEEGKIILNISSSAIQRLEITNHLVEFDASFSGKAMQVSVPVKAVLAIYARENGQGMMFNPEEEADAGDGGNAAPLPPSRSSRTGKPKLTIIK